MPAGLTDTLTRGELLDLTRFLSELGKIGPYAVGKARVIRRWQLLNVPVGQQVRSVEEALQQTNLTWQTIYSKVSGNLPTGDLPVIKTTSDSTTSVIRADLEVTTAGDVQFQLSSIDGLRIWLDGAALKTQETISAKLSAGPHQLVFAVQQGQRKQPLRVELLDIAGSAAQVQITTGK